MTAPRWIVEAYAAASEGMAQGDSPGADELAAALIDRLPMEEMAKAALEMLATGGAITAQATALGMIVAAIAVLADGDPEVVQLTELYQGACKVLDDAGVPYAIDVEIPPHIVIEATIGEMAPRMEVEIQQMPVYPGTQLELPDRIRWLVQQRPTRLDLQRVEAERDQLQRMYGSASDDLDRERISHQEAEAAAANRELALTVDLENVCREREQLSLSLAIAARPGDQLRGRIRSIIEGDFPAGDLRRALAELIEGDDWKIHLVDLERDALRRKIVDQAGYIEQLEVEITALEDEIWEDAP